MVDTLYEIAVPDTQKDKCLFEVSGTEDTKKEASTIGSLSSIYIFSGADTPIKAKAFFSVICTAFMRARRALRFFYIAPYQELFLHYKSYGMRMLIHKYNW